MTIPCLMDAQGVVPATGNNRVVWASLVHTRVNTGSSRSDPSVSLCTVETSACKNKPLSVKGDPSIGHILCLLNKETFCGL